MAFVYADLVKETSTTTGTGTYTLAGAVAGFQSFAAIGDTNECYYAAQDGTNWEVGVGTYTASGTTLARTSILASSNANAAVSWPSGTRTVSNVAPAHLFALVATLLANTSGTNTGDQTSVSGNAGTATKLATARTINGVGFDGTANISITAPAAGQLLGYNPQTGTNYTLAASDCGSLTRMTNAAACAFNIDTNAHVPVLANAWGLVQQGGAGTVTITALTGVTLRTPNGAATTAQYDARGFSRIGTTDEWLVW